MSAYTFRPSEGATATPTFPQGPLGKPFLADSTPSCGPSNFQVSPPSRDTCNPLPGPPLVNSQGCRRVCHMPANTIIGFEGSRQTSLAPVSGFLASTCFQVLPPSSVRYTPRSGFGPKA